MGCLWPLEVAESCSEAFGPFYCDDVTQGRVTFACIDDFSVDNALCHCIGQAADCL